jgi:indolepyruvate ferredoxin oxidoreductase beta subunit
MGTLEPIKIAILAMGGEGGGVLADWIVSLGESQGYIAQTTSVPGVAQRTGATIYYLELFPEQEAHRVGMAPVLSLMPTPGDVDVVLASELMEAGRAVVRGLVSPHKTTLIASTHRVYSMTEKTAQSDARVDAPTLIEQSRLSAQRFVAFDMAQVAQHHRSVISAVLFGALAASGALPFASEAFERTIEMAGLGVASSLAAFKAGMALGSSAQSDGRLEQHKATSHGTSLAAKPAQGLHPDIEVLLERLQKLPPACHPLALEGLRRLVDYQGTAYANLYLDRLNKVEAVLRGSHCTHVEILRECARHLALWMSYEDTARVADLKTRHTRFARVRHEAQVEREQTLEIHEYFHPRVQEVCETLPAWCGRLILNTPLLHNWILRLTQKGRVIQSTSLSGFLLLRTVALARHWRQSTLRYQSENSMIEDWLGRMLRLIPKAPELAMAYIECQGLVKGYSDTHERGVRNYHLVVSCLDRDPEMSAATLRSLRLAALADEDGETLRQEVLRLAAEHA